MDEPPVGLPRHWDFFLSYAPTDLVWAEWVAWHLEDAGFRVLLEAWDSVPGSNWHRYVQQGLVKAARVVALVSRDYVAWAGNEREWLAAAAADPTGDARRLVPVRIEDCPLPGLLGTVVSFDLFGLDEQAAQGRLLSQIRIVVGGRAKPARRPLFPARPTRAGRRPRFPEPGAERAISAGTSSAGTPEHQTAAAPVAELVCGNALARVSRTGWVGAVTFSPDGRLLVTGSDDRVTRVWNVSRSAEPSLVAEFTDHDDWVRAVACSPDGSLFAAGGADGVTVVRSLRRPTVPASLVTIDGNGNGGPVWSAAFSPTQRLLGLGTADGLVRLWHVGDPGVALLLGVLRGHEGQVGAVVFGPDGATVVAAGADGTVRLWDVADVELGMRRSRAGQEVEPTVSILAHADAVWALAISPGGTLLTTGSDDTTVGIWGVEASGGRQALSRLATLSRHTGRVRAVAFSPDGGWLVTGGDDGAARLWDVRRPELPELEATFAKVGGRVLAAAFAPRAGILALGSDDGRVRLFALPVAPPDGRT